jgi:hypothetical protein
VTGPEREASEAYAECREEKGEREIPRFDEACGAQKSRFADSVRNVGGLRVAEMGLSDARPLRGGLGFMAQKQAGRGITGEHE